MENHNGHRGDETSFSSQSVALRAQKKVLSKMANRNVAKHFINPTQSHLLDQFYRILNDFYGKKDAEKIVKNIIKMIIKMTVLARNDRLNGQQDILVINQFQKHFERLVLTVISFEQVDFSYDRSYLTELLQKCEEKFQTIVKTHLSDKSTQRVKMIFSNCSQPTFLDAVFKPAGAQGKYTDILHSICSDLNLLFEKEQL